MNVTGIVAQVSLYPMRQEKLSPAIDKALRTFREHGLHVEPGVMSTVIAGDEAAIFGVLQAVWHQTAVENQVVMVVTFSNACPVAGTGGVEG